MMRSAPILWVAAAFALANPGSTRADVTLEMKADSTVMKTFMTGEKLREEIGSEQVLIYRGDQQVLYMITPATKSYSETTREDLDAMKSKLDSMKSQMDAMMKNMPADRREMMEKMMKDKMPKAASDIKRTVKATGDKKTINGYPCSEYLVTTDKGFSSDVWATDLSSLGIEPKEFAVLKGFGDFFSSMVPAENLRDLTKDFEHPKPDDVPGFPVQMTMKDESGKTVGTVELVKVEKGSVAADLFEVPAGFQKQASPLGASPFAR